MDILAQFFELLFVRDAEVLLFVNNEQPEPLKSNRFAKQGVRANHNIDRAGFDAVLDLGQLLGGYKP